VIKAKLEALKQQIKTRKMSAAQGLLTPCGSTPEAAAAPGSSLSSCVVNADGGTSSSADAGSTNSSSADAGSTNSSSADARTINSSSEDGGSTSLVLAAAVVAVLAAAVVAAVAAELMQAAPAAAVWTEQ
jgi:hypothetical protein